MQSKSNVILNINIFFSMVKTQFRRIVKVCRSDNGSKFMNVVVNDFFLWSWSVASYQLHSYTTI